MPIIEAATCDMALIQDASSKFTLRLNINLKYNLFVQIVDICFTQLLEVSHWLGDRLEDLYVSLGFLLFFCELNYHFGAFKDLLHC